MSKNWIPKKPSNQTVEQKRLCREIGAKGKAERETKTARNIAQLQKVMKGMKLK